MIFSNRSIPRMAAASLALGACSGGDDGPATPGSVAHNKCVSLNDCDPTFYNYYDSVAECEDRYEMVYTGLSLDYYDIGGVDCSDAFLAFYDCFWDHVGDACNPDLANDACYDLWTAWNNACSL
jgi:hypothetical protein